MLMPLYLTKNATYINMYAISIKLYNSGVINIPVNKIIDNKINPNI